MAEACNPSYLEGWSKFKACLVYSEFRTNPGNLVRLSPEVKKKDGGVAER